MIELYHKTSVRISKLITRAYSTSFSLGILGLEKKYRNPIYNIYGFVRLADEIVDSLQITGGYVSHINKLRIKENVEWDATNNVWKCNDAGYNKKGYCADY